MRERPMADSSDSMFIMNRKRRKGLNIPSHLKLVDPRIVSTKLSDGLKGKKVCVLGGNSTTSGQDLQKILISLGAQPVPHSGFILTS